MANAAFDDDMAGARSLWVGRLLMLAAVLLWSTSGLFVKSRIFVDTWPEEHRGLLFGFWRAAFAGVLLLPLARRVRLDVRLVPMSLSFAVMNATFLSAMVLTTAANAIWLQATAPLWVLLYFVVVKRQRPRRTDVVFAALVVSGIAAILSEVGTAKPAGIVLGLVSGVSFAGVVVWLRALRDENGTWLIVVNQLVAAIAVLPLILWREAWHTPDAAQLAVLAAFGLFQIGVPYLLLAVAVRSIGSVEASALALLEPVLVPVWVALFRDELPGSATLVGATLILAGLAARYRFAA